MCIRNVNESLLLVVSDIVQFSSVGANERPSFSFALCDVCCTVGYL